MASGNVGGLTSVLNKRRKDRGAQLLIGLEGEIARELVKRGVGADEAGSIAAHMRAWFRDIYGGQLIYFPQEISAKAKARNDELMSKYTGDNITELSNIFNISEQQVYKIIRLAHLEKKKQVT
jgi:Mor family transcriptional regulator